MDSVEESRIYIKLVELQRVRPTMYNSKSIYFKTQVIYIHHQPPFGISFLPIALPFVYTFVFIAPCAVTRRTTYQFI
jgi:hypothetical protein